MNTNSILEVLLLTVNAKRKQIAIQMSTNSIQEVLLLTVNAKQKKFAIQMNIKKVLAHQQQIGFVKKRNVLVLMVLLLMDHRVIIMVRHRVILVSLDII
jgi:hypothetical protein